MEVLRGLITEFAIFSAPTPDEEQITTGIDDTENGLEGQDEFNFEIGHDDDDEEGHGQGGCTCAHDDANGLANNKNIEVVEPEEGADDEIEFSLDDEPEAEEPEEGTEDEDAEDKFKFF
jgi:hypothetical protein